MQARSRCGPLGLTRTPRPSFSDASDSPADSLLAVESYPVGNEIKDGHPPVSMGMLMKMGWDKDLTPAEPTVPRGVAPTAGYHQIRW